MSKKLISLVISLTFIITIGFKEMVYADTYVSGTVTASLNIRSGPSTSYAILGGFFKGKYYKDCRKKWRLAQGSIQDILWIRFR